MHCVFLSQVAVDPRHRNQTAIYIPALPPLVRDTEWLRGLLQAAVIFIKKMGGVIVHTSLQLELNDAAHIKHSNVLCTVIPP